MIAKKILSRFRFSLLTFATTWLVATIITGSLLLGLAFVGLVIAMIISLLGLVLLTDALFKEWSA